jgi:hypothetical protein
MTLAGAVAVAMSKLSFARVQATRTVCLTARSREWRALLFLTAVRYPRACLLPGR